MFSDQTTFGLQKSETSRDYLAYLKLFIYNIVRIPFYNLEFMKEFGELRRQLWRGQKTFLDHEFLFAVINHTGSKPTNYSWSHGADNQSYIGSGIIYFAIPYILKAKTCVCIGSGGGYVPRLMYQAQLEAKVVGAITILIDSDTGDNGRPDYMPTNSAFRKQFPKIEIIRRDSAAYAAEAQRSGLEIDYLHIDGDHTYAGALSDLENYLPLMSNRSLISFDDTDGTFPCAGVVPALRAMGHNIIDLPWVGNGIALIQPQR